MDPVKMETMESAASNKKSVINQMSTHVWNLFAKTNLFALCCVGAFLSLVRISFETIFALFIFCSCAIEKKLVVFCVQLFQVETKISRNPSVNGYGLRDQTYQILYTLLILHTHTCIHVVIDQKIFEGKRTRLSKYV